MRNTLETRLGLFVALAVLGALIILETIGGIERLQPGYRLYALFGNVQDLKPGDRIKMAGVDVGRVEDIKLDDEQNKVKVTLKVRKTAKVRTDSVATVKFIGLMGQNFISIDFGSATAPIASPGTTLMTKDQPDLNAVMAKIDTVAGGIEKITQTWSGDKLDNILGPITSLVDQSRGSIVGTLANIHAITKEIAEGKGSVGKLLYDEGALYNASLNTVSNLQDTSAEIKTTVGDARKVVAQAQDMMAQANSGQGTVGKLLKDEALYKETTASMTNLREILEKINQGQGSVGKIVNDQELYRNAKLTLQKLDKATEGLEDQGPLSVIGILFSKLF